MDCNSFSTYNFFSTNQQHTSMSQVRGIARARHLEKERMKKKKKTLQPNPHPRLLGLVLLPNPLKLGLCKFNVIINIINTTFRSGVAPKSKTLEYIFAEKPNTFKF